MHAIAPRRWYHEPMMWLAVAIPALTVPAGLTTWYLAATTGHADAVADPVRRVAQVQTTNLAADAEAARLGLSAVVHIDTDGRMAVELGAPLARDTTLLLSMRHPSEAARDQTIVLTGTGQSFTGTVPAVAGTRWDFVLADVSGGWRLVGRGTAGADPIPMAPALDRG
jgi:hypothetical protein